MLANPGFWIFENVFDDIECKRLAGAIGLAPDNLHRAGIRNLMSNDAVSAIANDERLIALTTGLTGKPMVPYKATVFAKTGKASWLVAWHQDTALPLESLPEMGGWGPISIKNGVTFAHAPTSVLCQILSLRIHLDDSNKTNGPLRVIPNSHHGRLGAAEIDELTNCINQVICTVGRGGVIAMSPMLVHASSKCLNEKPRRVLHIEYAPSLDIANGIKLATA